MHPVLVDFGFFVLPTYGTLMVVAFVASIVLLRREALHHGLDKQVITDLAVFSLFFGLIGSKALLIILDLPYYLEDPGRLLGTLRAAGVFYGGMIGALLGLFWLCRRKRLPFFEITDVMAPFLALGMAIGRLGCLSAGCCYGIPYEGPLALHFHAHPYCDAPTDLGLFPVQIVSSLSNLVIFFITWWVLRHRSWRGQTTLFFVGVYALTRGCIEFLRGDSIRGVFGGISTSQIIALVCLLSVVVSYGVLRSRARASGEKP